jgi:hypothetical protein
MFNKEVYDEKKVKFVDELCEFFTDSIEDANVDRMAAGALPQVFGVSVHSRFSDEDRQQIIGVGWLVTDPNFKSNEKQQELALNLNHFVAEKMIQFEKDCKIYIFTADLIYNYITEDLSITWELQEADEDQNQDNPTYVVAPKDKWDYYNDKLKGDQ